MCRYKGFLSSIFEYSKVDTITAELIANQIVPEKTSSEDTYLGVATRVTSL